MRPRPEKHTCSARTKHLSVFLSLGHGAPSNEEGRKPELSSTHPTHPFVLAALRKKYAHYQNQVKNNPIKSRNWTGIGEGILPQLAPPRPAAATN